MGLSCRKRTVLIHWVDVQGLRSVKSAQQSTAPWRCGNTLPPCVDRVSSCTCMLLVWSWGSLGAHLPFRLVLVWVCALADPLLVLSGASAGTHSMENDFFFSFFFLMKLCLLLVCDLFGGKGPSSVLFYRPFYPFFFFFLHCEVGMLVKRTKCSLLTGL